MSVLSYFAPLASAETDDEVNLGIYTQANPVSDNSNRYNALSYVSYA